MKILKQFLIRLTIVTIPLIGLYFYAQLTFEANQQKEHRTDVGLGIAILLVLLLLLLFIGFVIDFIVKLQKKEYKIALTDVPFLLAFIFFIFYFGCLLMGDYCEDCFCNHIINLGKWYLPH